MEANAEGIGLHRKPRLRVFLQPSTRVISRGRPDRRFGRRALRYRRYRRKGRVPVHGQRLRRRLQAHAVGGKYTESILHDFGGATKDGGIPVDALLLSGNELYGTTEYGGSGSCQETGFNGCGTVFEVSTKGSGYQVIYSFQGGKDGANPATSLIAGKNGVLYGTTNFGGGSTACTTGCGTAFELTPKGGKYTESLLYAFQGGQSDGSVPGNRGRGLYLTSNGSLIGTTHTGGSGRLRDRLRPWMRRPLRVDTERREV